MLLAFVESHQLNLSYEYLLSVDEFNVYCHTSTDVCNVVL